MALSPFDFLGHIFTRIELFFQQFRLLFVFEYLFDLFCLVDLLDILVSFFQLFADKTGFLVIRILFELSHIAKDFRLTQQVHIFLIHELSIFNFCVFPRPTGLLRYFFPMATIFFIFFIQNLLIELIIMSIINEVVIFILQNLFDIDSQIIEYLCLLDQVILIFLVKTDLFT